MNLLILSIFLWSVCFYLNRNGRIIPRIGGGCFGSGPEIEQIVPEQLITGEAGRTQAFELGQEQFPGALDAREFAIDLARDPTALNQFFSELAPSPLAQSVQESAFGPLLDSARREALQVSSLQGIPGAFSANFERAFSPTITSIGQFLSNQLENRGSNALANLFGVDPESVVGPIAGDIFGQNQQQANLNQQANIFNAQADFQNAQQRQRNRGGIGSTIGSVLGGTIGLLGGPAGVALGASLGGSLGGGIAGGGGQTPIDLGTALLLAQQGGGDFFGQPGRPKGGRQAGIGGVGGIQAGAATPVNFGGLPLNI